MEVARSKQGIALYQRKYSLDPLQDTILCTTKIDDNPYGFYAQIIQGFRFLRTQCICLEDFRKVTLSHTY